MQADHFFRNISCLWAIVHGVVFKVRQHFWVACTVFFLQASDHLFCVVTIEKRRLARELRIATKQWVSNDVAVARQ